MEKTLLTTTEAAHRLGIGRTKLYELLGMGGRPAELPVIRIGRAVRVPAKPIDAWVAKQVRQAVAPASARKPEE